MLDRGINVALGSDGAACSNRIDGWRQLWLSALVASARDGAGAVHTREAFEIATLGGARALGLADQIGSIEVGKRADLLVVDARPHLPNGDVYTTLVYSCRGADVRTVLVDGRVVVEDGRLLTLDAETVRREAVAARDALVARAASADAPGICARQTRALVQKLNRYLGISRQRADLGSRSS